MFSGGRCSCLVVLGFCFNNYGLGLTSFRIEVETTRQEVAGEVPSEEKGGFSHQETLCFLRASKLPAQGQPYNPAAHSHRGKFCLSKAALGFLYRSDLGALF